MAKTYYEKLKSPKWQQKRLKILERDSFKCTSCDNLDEEQLHVHHIVYRRVKNPWDYDDRDLVTLCETCHSNQHDYLDTLKDSIVDCYWDTGCYLDQAQFLYYINKILKRSNPAKVINFLNNLDTYLEDEENG